MPGGRVTTEPPVFTPIGLNHIMVSVTDVEKSAAHYRKLFGPEAARTDHGKRVWFRLANTRLGLEAAPEGRKPGFSLFCVKAADFSRGAAIAKLEKLGIKAEAGAEKGSVRFSDLNNLPVEVVGG
jgi:hypothetical protein